MAKGAVVVMEMDIDFDVLAKELDMSVEDVHERWDMGGLPALLEISFSCQKILSMADGIVTIRVPGGYL